MGNAIVAMVPALAALVSKFTTLLAEAPPQAAPIDPKVFEVLEKMGVNMEEMKQKQAEMAAENKRLQRLENDLKMKEAELDARGKDRYEKKDFSILACLRFHARKSLGIDSDKHVNICFTGKSGAGKSTLINAFLGLKPGQKGAAEVGVNECTDMIQQYQHPTAKHVFLWDVPGADTTKHPRETYFYEKCLFAFDYLVIVFTERFGEGEIDIIKQAIAHDVPFACARNKADEDFRSKRRIDERFKSLIPNEAVAELIEEHHANTKKCFRDANIDENLVNVYVVNAHALIFEDDEVMFEELALAHHLMETVSIRRGYGQILTPKPNRENTPAPDWSRQVGKTVRRVWGITVRGVQTGLRWAIGEQGVQTGWHWVMGERRPP